MEPVDIATATVGRVSYFVLHHPVWSVFAAGCLFLLLLRFYFKLTTGMCESDQRMDGKTVFITGASAGIGKETALDLANRGARVILGCRDLDKGRRVQRELEEASGNSDLHLQRLDLASFASVRQCAKDLIAREKALHVLINNAGISGLIKREMTEDGCEKTMQSNHLGHFLLTLLLLDLLKKSSPSRIVVVSSYGQHMAKLDLEDLQSERKFDPLTVYTNTKLANMLFTRELAARLDGTAVTVNALHPGVVRTEIIKNFDSVLNVLTRLLFIWIGKTPKEGAQTSIYLAVEPALEKKTGRYFSDCKEERMAAAAMDRVLARRLWEMSKNIVGLSGPS